jgi:hypothetical protein
MRKNLPTTAASIALVIAISAAGSIVPSIANAAYDKRISRHAARHGGNARDVTPASSDITSFSSSSALRVGINHPPKK